MRKTSKPIALIILDGFGYRPEAEHNAIAQAYSPHLDVWLNQRPHAIIAASGSAVGLPADYIGNSEVGHLTIGAGRVIEQSVTKIDKSIKDKSFFSNKTLIDNLQKLAKTGKTLHLMGLLSDAGVHSHINHLFAFLKAAHEHGIKHIVVHAFLDGRDVAPRSAEKYLTTLEKELKKYNASLGSIHGRFYAMDRDKNWDRTEKSYNVLTQKQDKKYTTWQEALKEYYEKNINDEFIPPTQLNEKGILKNGDGIIFFNFRPDRARQLAMSFVQDNFNAFKVKPLSLTFFITPTLYAKNACKTIALYQYPKIENTLKQVLIKNNKTILSIAETEKYAHVTYFFNGMNEEQLPGEERELVTSIKAKDYVNQPEMNAANITRTVLQSLKEENPLPEYLEGKKFDFYLINYANPDMVGHSGDFEATKKAIEFLDGQLAELYDEIVDKQDGTIFIVGDHGNAEDMFDEKAQQPNTAHTTNPIPFIMLNKHNMKDEILGLHGLADVAPFILHYMDLPVPDEMKR